MEFDLHGLTPVEAVRAYPEQAFAIMQKQAKELAQQSTNKQSTQCTCTNSCVATIYVCKDCGGRVNPKR